MLRQVSPLLFACLLLGGCEKLAEVGGKSGSQKSDEELLNGAVTPWSPEEQGNSSGGAGTYSGEVLTAFEEIARAHRAHNEVFLRNYDAGLPANGPAISEGIRALDAAARRHSGLTKQIIDAVNLTAVYEKSIFIPFDTMDRQLAGMESQGGTVAVQRRNYIRILDGGIGAYDKAVVYLESGKETRLRHNFKRKAVPDEVADEFIQFTQTRGASFLATKKEMFFEGRAALESYRTAYTQTDLAKAQSYLNEAKRHESKAKSLEAKMIGELRKILSRKPGR